MIVRGRIRCGEVLSLRPALCQPLLTPPLSFPFLCFSSDARFFVIPPALQFPEESFPREFFLGDLQSFFDVVIKNLDFHICDLRIPFTEVSVYSGVFLARASTAECNIRFLDPQVFVPLP